MRCTMTGKCTSLFVYFKYKGPRAVIGSQRLPVLPSSAWPVCCTPWLTSLHFPDALIRSSIQAPKGWLRGSPRGRLTGLPSGAGRAAVSPAAAPAGLMYILYMLLA